MFELSITDSIPAAHFLRGYKGPCKDLHGHTYKIEVVIVADELDDIGLVADFREVKGKLKTCLSALDHTNLNELPFFQDVNPSAENIARYIFQEFSRECRPLKLKHVRVWESTSASIAYYE